MSPRVKKSLLIFVLGTIVVSAILFLINVPMFDGEMVLDRGLGREVLPVQLSLSYFIGIGYNPAENTDVVDFYLKPEGWLLAFLFIIGIPGLVAYRIYLGKRKK